MASKKPMYELEKAGELFEQFIKDFEREYKDAEDRRVHYEAFVKSLEKINKLNSESSSATYGINKFADYTEDEMKMMCGFRKKYVDCSYYLNKCF